MCINCLSIDSNIVHKIRVQSVPADQPALVVTFYDLVSDAYWAGFKISTGAPPSLPPPIPNSNKILFVV